ncbi:MAG TPA: hypothetical protein VM307_10020 [Egibacteraceae bacterium]|nr:hypothetical protein [Egibacteraceae bacterium]
MAAARMVLRVLRDPKFRALVISLGPAAGKLATDLVRQQRWRQLAVVHADSVVDGSLKKLVLSAQPHWVVWSGDEAVAVYPPFDGDLDEALRNVDLGKRVRPDEMPSRQRRERVRQRGRALRRSLSLPHRRHALERRPEGD